MNMLSRKCPCRGCGAEIAFIKTVKGKTMPVDPEPMYFIPAGGPNTYVMIDGSIQRGREPQVGEGKAWVGYRSHWATCPEQDRFRKDRKKERTSGRNDG